MKQEQLKEAVEIMKDLKKFIESQSFQIKSLVDIIQTQQKVILRQEEFLKKSKS